MEARTDLDTSLKFSTDACLMDFGTFDKHGFIYVPPHIGAQLQSAPGTRDSAAAATQASSLDSSGKIAPLPGKGKVERTPPMTKDPGESQASSLQGSGSSDKIVPAGEGKVQKMPVTRDPGESAGDVIVDKLMKRKLDHVDSPEVVTGSFRRAKLMDNLRYLALVNKMSNWKRRKERKTSG